MTKLTESLSAVRRPIQKFTPPTSREKAAIFRQVAPERLRNNMGEREQNPKPARHCQPELATMLQCLKAHDFKEDLCAKEILAFNTCFDEFKRRVQVKEEMKERSVVGLSIWAMTGKQKNQLLKRFPQPTKTYK